MSKARRLNTSTACAHAAQQRSRARIFTEDDLARHARPGSCWVTLDRKVYDVVRRARSVARLTSARRPPL